MKSHLAALEWWWNTVPPNLQFQTLLSQKPESLNFTLGSCIKANKTENWPLSDSAPIHRSLQKSISIPFPTLHTIQLSNQFRSTPVTSNVISKSLHQREEFLFIEGNGWIKNKCLISPYLKDSTLSQSEYSYDKIFQAHLLNNT